MGGRGRMRRLHSGLSSTATFSITLSTKVCGLRSSSSHSASFRSVLWFIWLCGFCALCVCCIALQVSLAQPSHGATRARRRSGIKIDDYFSCCGTVVMMRVRDCVCVLTPPLHLQLTTPPLMLVPFSHQNAAESTLLVAFLWAFRSTPAFSRGHRMCLKSLETDQY